MVRSQWHSPVIGLSLAFALLAGLAQAKAQNQDEKNQDAKPKHLLVVTITQGFRHSSIAIAEKVLGELAKRSGKFTVEYASVDPSDPKFASADAGPGGPGGAPGGRDSFGPGRLLAAPMVAQADKNGDQKLTKEEFAALAEAWYDKLDAEKTGKLSQEQFAEKLSSVLPAREGGQRPGGRRGGPGRFVGPALFNAADADKNGSLTRAELKQRFEKWFGEWDAEKSDALNEEKLQRGLNAALPRPPAPGGPGGGSDRDALKVEAAVRETLAEKLSAAALKKYHGVIFANTTGNLPIPDVDGFLKWIEEGHAFIGMHSASDTFHGEKDPSGYTKMLNGEFQTHGPQVEVELLIADRGHPATAHLDKPLTVFEEMYLFKSHEPGLSRSLLDLDKHPNTKEAGHYPVAWSRSYGKGKVFYTSLGHREDIWDPEWKDRDGKRKNPPEVAIAYQQHILGGILWGLGLSTSGDNPKNLPQPGPAPGGNPPRREGERAAAGPAPPAQSGPPGGPGGFGGFQEELNLVEQFDKDGDKLLNAGERKAAREFLQKEREQGRGRRGPGGFGGQNVFEPGQMLAPHIMTQTDKNGDKKITEEEFAALAEAWFNKLDLDKIGKLTQEDFSEGFREMLPPQEFGSRGTVGSSFFTAADLDKDSSVTPAELKSTLGKWFAEWDAEKSGSLTEEKIRDGLKAALPRPSGFGAPGGIAGGGPAGGPGGGPGAGPGAGPGGFGFPGRGENQESPKPGQKLSPADVKFYPDDPLYEVHALRTFFLEFENADWEKELADFKNTDVEVPARLTVDGKSYQDVGVHFRGMSSYMAVGEGRKRSLNLSLDFVNNEQEVGGYRTLNLLNSHEDPTYLRSVLYYQIAHNYIPTAKANFARVVINGESWGLYVNSQQFNKDFIKEWFDTTKGARWKVPGSPGGRGTLAYLGDDPAPYKRIYELKSKDNPESWAALIKLCKVLNETPAEKIEEALAPLLNIDGALKFLALENALINNDGYWIRTSDYNIYQDEKGRMHILPHDINEAFSFPGGPGFGGGAGGGPGGFEPGRLLAPALLSQADKNGDQKLALDEFTALAGAWFDKLDAEKTGKLSQERFVEKLGDVLPPLPGTGGPAGGPPPEGDRGFGPGRFLGPALFTAADLDKDGVLTRPELKQAFEKWFVEWDAEKSGSLNEEKLRNGLSAVLPRAGIAGGPGGGPGAGPGGGPGGRGRRGGGPGFGGGGPRINGVELNPLVSEGDPNKPLASKLLAVPSLRARYLGTIRDIADKWLDWDKLGPLALEYQSLIEADVRNDTRKLDSTEDFLKGVTENLKGGGFGGFGGRETISLKNFVEQRRKFLLNHPEVKKANNK